MEGWEKISVSSGSGVFENENEDFWGDFLSLLKFRDVTVEINNTQSCWCPFRSSDWLACDGHIGTKNSSYRDSTKTVPAQPSMIAAVAAILQSLGEDPLRKELVGTPQRFVNWLMNFKRSSFEMKLNGFGSGRIGPLKSDLHRDNTEIHSVLNLPFWSQCEHHLLPFHGVVHMGYFHPRGADPVGRSILQSIVHFYGYKLQVQERLTRQIAETVSSLLGDVMVVVEANNICMISRGIEKVGSNTATIAVLGRFSNDPSAKAMFLQIISNNTANGATHL
uniref:GTP cyclohydrolase 1 n=1 Tax=Nelumbo nucifera TaxID=4432 RepID=A0A822YX44_NELNU|nr:TPA_asm: hypothetical protein HUJ06_007748 [Nelumbo nucifera]